MQSLALGSFLEKMSLEDVTDTDSRREKEGRNENSVGALRQVIKGQIQAKGRATPALIDYQGPGEEDQWGHAEGARERTKG